MRHDPADLPKMLAVLDLGPGASFTDVKAARRTLNKVWHPDRFPGDAALQRHAEEKLKQINAAYAWIAERQDLLAWPSDPAASGDGTAAPRPQRGERPRPPPPRDDRPPGARRRPPPPPPDPPPPPPRESPPPPPRDDAKDQRPSSTSSSEASPPQASTGVVAAFLFFVVGSLTVGLVLLLVVAGYDDAARNESERQHATVRHHDVVEPRLAPAVVEMPATPTLSPGIDRYDLLGADGMLTVHASDSLEVHHGGRLLGTTPIVRFSLPAGEQRLTLTDPLRSEWSNRRRQYEVVVGIHGGQELHLEFATQVTADGTMLVLGEREVRSLSESPRAPRFDGNAHVERFQPIPDEAH